MSNKFPESASDGPILDPVRRKTLVRGPEEEVRQRVLAYLIGKLGVPRGLIAVEKSIEGSGDAMRADIVVHDRAGKPWLLVECKAPEVRLDQGAFDQIGRYNRVIRAPYLFITNGTENYCARWDADLHTLSYLDHFPTYPDTSTTP